MASRLNTAIGGKQQTKIVPYTPVGDTNDWVKPTPYTPVGDTNDWTPTTAKAFLKSREEDVPTNPAPQNQTVTNYYNDLISYLDEMNARNTELAKAQEAQRQKQIADYTDQALRKQQSAYNKQRRDIVKASGNMSGAKVAGLTNAGNNNNNAITAINNNESNLRADSNITYLGALADIAQDNYKNKYNLLSKYYEYL